MSTKDLPLMIYFVIFVVTIVMSTPSTFELVVMNGFIMMGAILTGIARDISEKK